MTLLIFIACTLFKTLEDRNVEIYRWECLKRCRNYCYTLKEFCIKLPVFEDSSVLGYRAVQIDTELHNLEFSWRLNSVKRSPTSNRLRWLKGR